MILLAAKNLDLDLKQSWLIGDAPRDIHAGRAAGVRTILFKPPGIPVSPEATDESSADFETNTLEEAMDYINHHRA
jgi:D-glycero-D-manno-heptose 1,7-bisphosphate phosphatase